MVENSNGKSIDLVEYSKENDNTETGTYVIINNSPIDMGHVLLVPRLYSSLNQVPMSYLIYYGSHLR